MRICFLCSEYPPVPHGGIGSVTQTLGRALAAHGDEVKVVGIYAPGEADSAPQFDQGVEVWRLPRPSSRLGWMAARYRVFRQVTSWASRGLIDLVECPDWEGWTACWPRLSVPIVARLHGSSSYFSAELGLHRRASVFWLERAALRRADFWCSVSRYTARKTAELFQAPASPTAVIYNSVEIPEESESNPRDPNDVVFSGTLTAKKGVYPLVRAWARVHQSHPAARLHLYGKDTTRPGGPSERSALLEELPPPVRPSVVFHGHQPREQLLQHLRRARLAVFPSFAEAFAMAPLEAMAQACPTIYSTLGSGPELIDDGVDGILVDPAHPPALAAAIGRLLDDPAFAARLGEAGRAKVLRRFSTGAILQSNLQFYEECRHTFLRRRTG